MHLLCKQLIFAVAMLLVISTASFARASEDDNTNENIWVWADSLEGRNEIFLTRGVGEEWATPEKLSANIAVNVVPAAIKLLDGRVFVVWSAFEGGQSKIVYRIEGADGWGEETVFPSDLTQNTAPTAATDSEGNVWLIWAGFNGLSDEIFYSIWDGTEFTTAVALTNNDIPDILPVVGYDRETKTLWIEWQQFTKNGYVFYQVTNNDGNWSEPAEVNKEDDSASQQQSTVEQVGQKEDETGTFELVIPEVVTDVESASVHIPGNAIQALPMRSITIEK